QAVFGPRHAAVERLVAGDVLRVLELARVDAQVAVGGLQQPLQVVEREPLVGRERADDPEPEPFVDDAIEVERAAAARGGPWILQALYVLYLQLLASCFQLPRSGLSHRKPSR